MPQEIIEIRHFPLRYYGFKCVHFKVPKTLSGMQSLIWNSKSQNMLKLKSLLHKPFNTPSSVSCQLQRSWVPLEPSLSFQTSNEHSFVCVGS